MGIAFDHLDLVVSDVKATVEFYRLAGVDIPADAVWEQDGAAHHVAVGVPGEVQLGIDSRELTRGYDVAWPASSGTIIIFALTSREAVDEKFAQLTGAGYEAHMGPIDAFWGSRYAIVDDPDGNHVGFMSPQDREHKETPAL